MNKLRSTFAVLGVACLAALSQPALAAKPGAPCKPAGHDYDYTVSAVPEGMNLYATTSCGMSLVSGSPTVPSPAPLALGGNPVPSPQYVFTDPKKDHVYALYNTGPLVPNPPQLWSFEVTPTGLQQLEMTYFSYAAFENPKFANANVYLTGATAHLVYLVYHPSDIYAGYNLTVWAVDNGYFSTRTDIEFTVPNEPPLAYGPSVIQIDSSNGFIYACFLQETQPSVWVYHVKAGVPTFAFISSDSDYIASVCN